MQEELDTHGLSRRTLVKGAAWSVPVVAVAVATPLAAASATPPAATFWATGATVSVVSGNVTNFTVEGSDADGNLALLPSGTSVTIVPDAGVTLAVVNAIGIVVTHEPPTDRSPASSPRTTSRTSVSSSAPRALRVPATPSRPTSTSTRSRRRSTSRCADPREWRWPVRRCGPAISALPAVDGSASGVHSFFGGPSPRGRIELPGGGSDPT